jgi:hypothetical protein
VPTSLGPKCDLLSGRVSLQETGISGSSLDLHGVTNQLLTMLHANLIVVASCALGVGAKKLWANEPAAQDNIIMTAYPVGNGKLGGKCSQVQYVFKFSLNLDTDDMLSTSPWNRWRRYCCSE